MSITDLKKTIIKQQILVQALAPTFKAILLKFQNNQPQYLSIFRKLSKLALRFKDMSLDFVPLIRGKEGLLLKEFLSSSGVPHSEVFGSLNREVLDLIKTVHACLKEVEDFNKNFYLEFKHSLFLRRVYLTMEKNLKIAKKSLKKEKENLEESNRLQLFNSLPLIF